MTVSVEDFLVRRQLLTLERKVASQLSAAARISLEHFAAVNAQLQARRDELLGAAPRRGHAAPGAAWLVPAPRVARAHRLWHEEACAKRFTVGSPARLRLALVVGGGVGDHLKASAAIPGLFRAVDADITYITDNSTAPDIFRSNPYVRQVCVTRRNPHELTEECFVHTSLFDLVVSWKYTIEYSVPARSRLSSDAIAALTTGPGRKAEEFRRYYYCNEMWPKYNQSFGRAMVQRGFSALGVGAFTSGVETATDYAPNFFPDPRALKIVEALSGRDYITVHHGFDVNHLPEKSTRTSYGSTKNIAMPLWREIVTAIRAANIEVIQLGVAGEEEIPGISINLCGQTEFSETAMVLKNALCHVDTEGGLVHLARVAHTRSVVLFGPTPVGVFGYAQNINMEPRACHACWYSATNWVVQCPRLTEGPQCMAQHRADQVIAAVDQILDDARDVTLEVTAAPLGAHAELADLLALPALRPGQTGAVLLIGEQPVIAQWLQAGPLPACSLLIASDGAGAVPVPAAFEMLRDPRVTTGSLFNLPTASDSLDAVICRSAVWSGAHRAHALREMVRVLKPGGVLVVWPMAGADIAGLLAQAGFAASGAGLEAGAAAFVIAKHSAAQRRPPRIGGPFRNLPGDPPAAAHHDGVDDYERQLAERIMDVDELVFDTYRCYVQRTHVNDAIWANKQAILEASLDNERWISMSSTFCEVHGDLFTGAGWHPPEPWGVWGAGQRHVLLLPVGAGAGEMVLEAAIALTMAGLAQRTVTVSVAGHVLDVWTCRAASETRRVRIPVIHAAPDGVLVVEFRVDMSIIPTQWELSADDKRDIGMGLARFRYGFSGS